jgi:predicted unusual protein kinase regulating ubiquinone biosynthesis (AarF/ABC1/UbiB family)
MCSALNPEFNIWTAIEPYSTKLVRAGGTNALQGILETVSDYARIVVRLPQRVDKLVTRAEHGQLTVRSLEVERRVSALNRSVRRVMSAVLFGGLFIGGLVIFGRNETLGIVVLCTSALPLLHAVFAEWFARRGPLP